METPDVFCAYSRFQPADVITHIRHILFILWAKKGLDKHETTNGVYLRVTVLYYSVDSECLCNSCIRNEHRITCTEYVHTLDMHRRRRKCSDSKQNPHVESHLPICTVGLDPSALAPPAGSRCNPAA